MIKLLLILSSLLVLNACSDKEQKDLDEETTPPLEEIDEQEGNEFPEEAAAEIDFRRYFKPANSTASFKGEGNEFASYTEKTNWLGENYVATVINNGGAVIMKVYRVIDTQIELVMDELVEGMPEDANYPDIATLDELPALEIYLAGPIEVGTTFENWTIIETGITLSTPYQTFNNVFVIEETGEGFSNKKYIVEDYGIIKTESVMSAELSEEVTVTSTLENIALH